jgi:MFS family permease
MFIYHNIPLTARPTYYHNLRSAILGGVAFSLYSQAGVVARKIFDAPGWQIALIAAAPAAGWAMCLFWGRLETGRHKMPFILYPAILSRIPLLVAGFVKSALGFTVTVSLPPLIWSIGQPAYASIVRSNYPAEQRGLITGTLQAWNLLASCMAAYAAGLLLDWQPSTYAYVFPASAVIGVMSALVFARIRVRGEKHLDAVFAPLKNRRFMIFMASFMCGGLANLIAIPVLTIFLTDDLKVTFTRASMSLAVIPQVAMLLTLSFWGKLVDRKSPITLRMFTSAGFTLSFLLLYVAALFSSLNLVYLSKLVEGLVMGLSSIVWTLGIMYFAPKAQIAIYMGVHTALTGIRGLIAPFLGTWLMEYTKGRLPYFAEGVRCVFLLSVALSFLSFVFMAYEVIGERRKFGYLPTLAEAEAMHEGAPIGETH